MFIDANNASFLIDMINQARIFESILEPKLTLTNICDNTSTKIFCLWQNAIFNSRCASYEQCALNFDMIISLVL